MRISHEWYIIFAKIFSENVKIVKQPIPEKKNNKNSLRKKLVIVFRFLALNHSNQTFFFSIFRS